MTDNQSIESLIILGAGPAGLSAALYAARAELSPLVFTGLQIGGQAALTSSIENYPGFPQGIGGGDLGDLFQKQAERFGARVEYNSVTGVDLSTRPFKISTYSNQYQAKAIIIATGASPVHLGVPGEEILTGQGVSYCATCDGWFFKEKEVVVVGGGDSALEEAIHLTKFATKVTIIHRRDAFRAGAILQTRARNNSKIVFLMDSIVKEIQGEGKVNAVLVENVKTGQVHEYGTDGVFVFIGHTPNTQMFRQYLDLDERGYIKVNMKMETSVDGVFACGEAADPEYKQVVTSAGMGAAAAIQANRYLEKLEDNQ